MAAKIFQGVSFGHSTFYVRSVGAYDLVYDIQRKKWFIWSDSQLVAYKCHPYD